MKRQNFLFIYNDMRFFLSCNFDFKNSYEEIIIAQAGATRNDLGTTPLKKPKTPLSFNIEFMSSRTEGLIS